MIATARSDLVGPVGGMPIYSPCPRIALTSIPPSGADYTYRDTFDLVSTVTAPCGTSTVLNIVSDLRASNSKNTAGSGYIATDSVCNNKFHTGKTGFSMYISDRHSTQTGIPNYYRAHVFIPQADIFFSRLLDSNG